MSIARTAALAAAFGLALLAGPGTADAQERQVKITGFGAMSGVVRSFGINSKAALEAAADQINKAGGVTLGDGAKGKIVIDFLDDRCNAEEGISVLRRIASGEALVAIGPTCSNVAEPLFGVLQKKVGDAGDTGLQFPVFTDVAIKIGLAKISEWAFRNVPNEIGDVRHALQVAEGDQARSQEPLRRRGGEFRPLARHLVRGHEGGRGQGRLRGQGRVEVAAGGHQLLQPGARGQEGRRRHHRHRRAPVLDLRHAEGDGAPGREAEAADRAHLLLQHGDACRAAPARPRPSSSRPASLPSTTQARAAADAVTKFKGSLDLHSGAAWENVFILKKIIEDEKVMAKADTLKADREKIRAGLAKLTATDGLLGKSTRTPGPRGGEALSVRARQVRQVGSSAHAGRQLQPRPSPASGSASG